jgi:hypothetical protein
MQRIASKQWAGTEISRRELTTNRAHAALSFSFVVRAINREEAGSFADLRSQYCNELREIFSIRQKFAIVSLLE